MPVTVKLRKYYIQVREFPSLKYSILKILIICISKTNSLCQRFTDEGNQALQEFLAARNPKQQHSSTLESYLIKPIQRILKYPLLLQQLRNLTDVNSEEHLHLVGKKRFNSK